MLIAHSTCWLLERSSRANHTPYVKNPRTSPPPSKSLPSSDQPPYSLCCYSFSGKLAWSGSRRWPQSRVFCRREPSRGKKHLLPARRMRRKNERRHRKRVVVVSLRLRPNGGLHARRQNDRSGPIRSSFTPWEQLMQRDRRVRKGIFSRIGARHGIEKRNEKVEKSVRIP
jgi:hypothetical protein